MVASWKSLLDETRMDREARDQRKESKLELERVKQSREERNELLALYTELKNLGEKEKADAVWKGKKHKSLLAIRLSSLSRTKTFKRCRLRTNSSSLSSSNRK